MKAFRYLSIVKNENALDVFLLYSSKKEV